MRTILDEIEAQAQKLPDNERAELAERLLESLATSQRPDVQAAWLALARKRRDEVRSGTVAGIPGKEGSAMVRGLVGG